MPMDPGEEHEVLDQNAFMRMLALERKRSERSNSGFVLMLIESPQLFKGGAVENAVRQLRSALSQSTRETDIKGWYLEESVIGVIFTEIDTGDGRTAATALESRMTATLRGAFSGDDFNSISMSFHVFPESAGSQGQDGGVDLVLYPELQAEKDGKDSARWVKRAIDILGSVLALIVAGPIMLVIALGIKATSRGPVIFKQVRVGLRGKTYTFFKFRTMYSGNNQGIHKDFTKRLIAGTAAQQSGGDPVYKLRNDPRVTSIGRFLRRTSLDEVPQFWNVLKGDMSLVGPRPPIPYEVEAYAMWHKRRLLTVKPGITGLWQVAGRSRVSFDDMVRLDLRYARSWTVLQDIRILLKTPAAVFSGNGAY
jgi:lipopolysaccharide/colanic/teichoic acid biosynthesis glycosyltransferase